MKNKVSSITFYLDMRGRTRVVIRRKKYWENVIIVNTYKPSNKQIKAINFYLLQYGSVRPEPDVSEDEISLYYPLWHVTQKDN